MSDSHKVIFYPVGNGDSSQIILLNKKRILLDYCHRRNGEDGETPEIDLKSKLKTELEDVNRDYFDVVAFTHADDDHIRGSTDFFELEYSKKYQGGDRTKIKELWVPAAMLLEEASRDEQSEEFVILRQEARHRLLEGEKILVFSKPQRLMDWLIPKLKERGLPADARDHLFVDAGQIVPGLTLAADGIEFFCHSPFVKHCDDGDIIRNDAALVFNVRFRIDGNEYDYFAVGDASWEALEDIVEITKAHKNDDRLDWDLFNVPHHCSYKALSDEKGEKETIPKDRVKELLEHGKHSAYEVSSSKPIPNHKSAYSEKQPPHIQARNTYERYLKNIGGRKFLVTMEEPNANKPKPLEFEVSSGGITWAQSSALGAAAIITSKPHRAG